MWTDDFSRRHLQVFIRIQLQTMRLSRGDVRRNLTPSNKTMNPDWWKHPATEHQKEKLRFFGCTWDEGITARQASDALEECARQFPSKQIEVEKWFQQLEDAKIQAEWSKNRNAVEAQEKSPPDVAVQKMETVAKLPDTAAAVPVLFLQHQNNCPSLLHSAKCRPLD